MWVCDCSLCTGCVCACILLHPAYAVSRQVRMHVCVCFMCVGMCKFCALGRLGSFFSSLPYFWNPFNIPSFFFIYSTLETYLSRNWVAVHFCWIIGDRLEWFKAQTPLLVWLLGTLLSFLNCSLNHFSIIIFFLSLWTAGTTSPHPPTAR